MSESCPTVSYLAWSRRWPADGEVKVAATIVPPAWVANSNCTALAWRKVRETAVGRTALGRNLARSHRFQVIESMSAVSRLAKIWRRLEDAGLHAILIKGWSTARLYPEPGLNVPATWTCASRQKNLPVPWNCAANFARISH